jgi:hypothetical protein
MSELNHKFKEEQLVTNAQIKTELLWHRWLLIALITVNFGGMLIVGLHL